MADPELHGERQAEIAAWFLPTSVPYGGAPEAIREQWLGVPLPIREQYYGSLGEPRLGADVDSFETRVNVNAVPIELVDAIKALRIAGQDSAAQWWEGFSHEIDGNPMYASTLSFRASEGEVILPEEVEDRLPGLPGIEDFDSPDL